MDHGHPSVADYLVPHGGHDWGALLAPWADLLPSELTVWLVNRIGDAIVVVADGSVHLLDVGRGALDRLAGSRDEFLRKVDEGDNACRWFAMPLVDRLAAAGLRLGPGQCYGFVTPPLLGGDYVVDNIRVYSIAEHYGYLGAVYRQTRHLPDGTRVRIVIED